MLSKDLATLSVSFWSGLGIQGLLQQVTSLRPRCRLSQRTSWGLCKPDVGMLLVTFYRSACSISQLHVNH